MSPTAYLTLENNAIFKGRFFGAEGSVTGEIVFATGMTGYLETLTDQSYHGQIVLQTFPLIGNYGVIPSDFESASIGPAAYIVKHFCQDPSNFRSEGNLDIFFKRRGLVGLCGIDTRALTRIIRENGVMNGKITAHEPTAEDLAEIRAYKIQNAVGAVSIKKPVLHKADDAKYTVALMDFGLKHNIRRELLARGADVWEFPHNATLEDISAVKPDGVMLSNGPGDPADNPEIIANLREIAATGIPIFGICLGHQLLALASGFATTKLKYGHRGANQPARDTQTGRVYITSQNHGYAVVSESINPDAAAELFTNVNDGTCEGILYKNINAFSSQFHPEAAAGPRDTAFLFDRFIQNIEAHKQSGKEAE